MLQEHITDNMATTQSPGPPPPPHGHPDSDLESGGLFISLVLFWLPGTFLNITALVFITRDIRKAVFPAIILLFMLCLYDLLSVMFSMTQHMLEQNTTMTTALCSVITFFFTYFHISSGTLNTLMAVDRVLAIGAPFYYKLHVEVRTWKIVCTCAGVLTMVYSTFPMIGLGSIWSRDNGDKSCLLGYQEEPIKRVFGVMFGLVDTLITLGIVVCNVVLIRFLLKMSRTVISVPSVATDTSVSEDPTATKRKQQTSFEVAFAKLMICLSIAYLICGTPTTILIIHTQFNMGPIPQIYKVIGYSIGGFLPVLDPIIYILMRKTTRKKIFDFCCRCVKR